MKDKYIVCVLDVLGYRQLVSDHGRNPGVIGSIRNLYGKLFGIMDGMKDKRGDPLTLANSKISEHIKIRLISDSVLITMPLPDLPLLVANLDSNVNVYYYVTAYLNCICWFYLLFTSRLGYFLRGAVSIGQHYESMINDDAGNVFIFSQAMIDAFDFGKTADSPRVLIGNTFYEYFSDLGKSSLQGNPFDGEVFKDSDGLNCLDIYQCLQIAPGDNMTMDILNHIFKVVKHQIERNKKEPAILRKYCCFAKYHNKRLSSWFNYPELMITDFDR